MLKGIALATAAVSAAVGIAMAAAPAATAYPGSDGYDSATCYATGGNLHVTNYYITVSGSRWQEYHYDADRAGGTGDAPKVYWRLNSNYAWQILSGWNDAYIRQSNEYLSNDFKVKFANGSSCIIYTL